MNRLRCMHLHIALLSLWLLHGCRTSPDPLGAVDGQALEERRAVLDALRNINHEAFRNAFANRPSYPYVRYTRTEQLDDALQRTAFTERVTRVAAPPPHDALALYTDSGGTFDKGALGRFVGITREESRVSAWPRYVLLEDPPYLAPRNRDDYRYAILPDTVLGGLLTQVLDVHARPGTDQAIRRARFYLDRSSQALLAVYLERVEHALFFQEESRFYLRIRRTADEAWVPYYARFRTRLRLPLHAPQHLRTITAFYDGAP